MQNHPYFRLQPHPTYPYSTISWGKVLQMDSDSPFDLEFEHISQRNIWFLPTDMRHSLN
jgi:hypothetical protein